MIVYDHTQVARPIVPIVAGVLFTIVAIAGIVSGETPALIVAVVMAVIILPIAIAFSRLTVTVDDSSVQARFGTRWPRLTIDLGDIVAARVVRNRWWYGFGIRWYPGGILWNVWGLDAVELEMQGRRTYRIGTDDADQLIAALAGRVPLG